MDNKFRASFSVLNTWKSGDWERAVKMYFKLDQFTSRAMADGKDWHALWQKHIEETSTLPVEFGGKKLHGPWVEKKLVVEIEPWLDLVGVVDCIDLPTIYEFKTGKQSSEAYASSPQVGLYGVLMTYSGIYVDRAEIHHFDQYTKQHDMSIVWLTDKVLNDAHNWIITLSSEMHNYFVTNSLYEKFGEHLAKQNGNRT